MKNIVKKPKQMRVHYEDSNVVELISKELKRLIIEGLETKKSTDIVFICIGTDRSTGDSLGPLVGNGIYRCKDYNVFGTLENPVHAKNLEDTVEEIYRQFENPYIIAIDACLGKANNVGYICIGNGAIKPGAGLDKNLPEIGDISIIGIVNLGGFMDFAVLQNTRLNIVMKMSKYITFAIRRVMINLKREYKTRSL